MHLEKQMVIPYAVLVAGYRAMRWWTLKCCAKFTGTHLA